MCMSNLMVGKRYISIENHLCIKSINDNLLAVVFFDPDSANNSWFLGGIVDKIIGFIIKKEHDIPFEKYTEETK